MNSFIKYTPKSLSEHKAFQEHLLSIIDTKLQYIKHHTNTLIAAHTDTPFAEQSDVLSKSLDVILEKEAVFSLIEKYSKKTNLLLLLRTKLHEKNVSIVYDLLNNDDYLDYSSKDLEKKLDQH